MLAQKITAFLLATLLIWGAAWLIVGALRFRLRGVAVTGIIVAIRSTDLFDTGVLRTAIYRYRLPDGSEFEAEGDFGSDAAGYAVGDRRKLFALARRPHLVHEADNVVRESFGLMMLATALWLLRWLWVGNGG
jgi:hypothetical protein